MVRATRGGRAREVCAFVASSEPQVAPKMASSATKIGFQLLLCEKGLPAVQSRVQDRGFFFC